MGDRRLDRVAVGDGHDGLTRVAVAHALGTPLDLFQRIVISPGSISAIAYRAQGPAVLTVNSLDGDLTELLRG